METSVNKANRPLSRLLDRCDRGLQNESRDPNGGNNVFVSSGYVYITIPITFLTRKSALIYRRGLHQRGASLTIDCNGVFAIKGYDVSSRTIPDDKRRSIRSISSIHCFVRHALDVGSILL